MAKILGVSRVFFAVFFLMMWSGLGMAAESYGTREEAQAMVERAAAFLKANGREVALAEFGNPKGQFIDRDLYLVTYDAATGVRLSHPINPKLVGKSTADMKDLDGKPYGQEILTTANTMGSGWVDFKFSDPITKKLGDKSFFVMKVDNIIIGCGAYKH